MSDDKNSKKSVFANYSVLTDFFHYLHLPLYLFLFEFFWGKELFEEVATVADALLDVLHMLELNTKWIYYFDCTNVANENCDEFCMKEDFKCREKRMI